MTATAKTTGIAPPIRLSPWRALGCWLGAVLIGPPIGGLLTWYGLVGAGQIDSSLPDGTSVSGYALLALCYLFGVVPATIAGVVFAAFALVRGTVSYLETALIALIGAGIGLFMLVGADRPGGSMFTSALLWVTVGSVGGFGAPPNCTE